MKKFVLAAVVVMIGFTAVAQNSKSIVGKWKIASIKGDDGTLIDLEDPKAIKAMLAEQAKQAGQEADSASMEMGYAMFTMVFDAMTFEFTADNKFNFASLDQTGKTKKDIGSYTYDAAKGTLITTSTENGKEKTENLQLGFEGDYLLLQNPSKDKAVIKLKKA